MNPVLVVFRKEMRDNLRDRRSLLSSLIYPLLGPLLFAALLSVTTRTASVQEIGTQQPVPVIGAEAAPELVRHLAKLGIVAAPPVADIEAAVAEGRVGAAIVIPADFARRLARGDVAEVTVINDASSLRGEILAGRLARALTGYGRTIAEQRLAARGVPPETLEPVLVNNVILEERRSAADLFLFMLPPFLMFTLFIGGVYVAIDVTSGERERGSFEYLMAAPVPRWQIMLGKFFAAYVFTALSLAVQLGAFGVVFNTVGHGAFSEGIGFGPAQMAAVALIALPAMVFTVAIQLTIAAMTRSFKEAQTWLGLLPMVPAVPGMVTVFLPLHPQMWMMTVPVFSQLVTIAALLRGIAISPAHAAVSALATVAAGVLLLRWVARLFEREAMVFPG